ncbi:uncharacterized protein LOC144569475 isoform X2 [Carex rostrata]
MEREFFSQFYFGNINGEAIREGKKLQPNEPQFGDFNFATTKQDVTIAGIPQREENNTMVVNFSHLPRSVNSIDVPFNKANLGSGESSTSVDSMGFQAKEKGIFENEQSKTNKRKGRDASEFDAQSKRYEDEENGSDARKSDQRITSSRRSRPAEMHNLSERRRRDRINERLKALQELLPHCTKTDKASMLDEAIEYLKSLQIQLQMMWIESGMVPMIFPESHQYISITATDYHHVNSLPYNPRITRSLFDDQLKSRDLNANQPVTTTAQTDNLYLHKFSLQGTNQREFGAGTVQEPHFADGLVIDGSSFL